MAPKQGKEVLRVTLDEDLIRDLKVMAAQKGRPVRVLVTGALTKHLKDQEQQLDG